MPSSSCRLPLFTALIVTQVFGSGEVLALDERAGGLAAAAVAVALRAPAWLVLLAAVLTTATLRALTPAVT